MKKIVLAIISLFPVLAVSSSPAQAGRLEPTAGNCWFFRRGQLDLKQACIYSGYSWAGGGFTTLEWDDGVRTTIAFGLQGRGERPCPELSVDGVCGEWRYRDPRTFQPLTEAERTRRQITDIPVLQCADVNHNSVCWSRR